jgi:hypothetical protein
MAAEDAFRLMVGILVALSVLLVLFHSPYWLFLTALIAVGLIQSAFTKWCPGRIVLEKLGLPCSCSTNSK